MSNEITTDQNSYFDDLVSSEKLTIAMKLVKFRYGTNRLFRDIPEAELTPLGEIGNLLGMIENSSPKDWISNNNYWDKPVSVLLVKALNFVKFHNYNDTDDDDVDYT